MIRNAVLHLTNEQPLLADLLGEPGPTDTQLICTNLRSMNGKRPVFADDSASVFAFPIAQVRFVEMPPGTTTTMDPTPRRASDVNGVATNGTAPDASDGELELDEDFLRRVREA